MKRFKLFLFSITRTARISTSFTCLNCDLGRLFLRFCINFRKFSRGSITDKACRGMSSILISFNTRFIQIISKGSIKTIIKGIICGIIIT